MVDELIKINEILDKLRQCDELKYGKNSLNPTPIDYAMDFTRSKIIHTYEKGISDFDISIMGLGEIPRYFGDKYEPNSVVGTRNWISSKAERKEYISFNYVKQNVFAPWFMHWVSFHPDIDYDFVAKNPGMGFTSEMTIRALTKGFNIFEQYPNLPWDMTYVTKLAPFDFIDAHPRFAWDMQILTERANTEFIDAHLQLAWNMQILTKRATLEFIHTHPQFAWDADIITAKSDFTFEFYKQNTEIKWNMPRVTENMSTQIIESNPEIDWDIPTICEKFFSFEYIEAHSHWPWNAKILSKHSLFPSRLMIKYPNWDWDWDALTRHEKLDWEFVIQNPNLGWNWHILSSKVPSKDYVKNNLQLKWDLTGLRSNPRITTDFLRNIPCYRRFIWCLN